MVVSCALNNQAFYDIKLSGGCKVRSGVGRKGEGFLNYMLPTSDAPYSIWAFVHYFYFIIVTVFFVVFLVYFSVTGR